MAARLDIGVRQMNGLSAGRCSKSRHVHTGDCPALCTSEGVEVLTGGQKGCPVTVAVTLLSSCTPSHLGCMHPSCRLVPGNAAVNRQPEGLSGQCEEKIWCQRRLWASPGPAASGGPLSAGAPDPPQHPHIAAYSREQPD